MKISVVIPAYNEERYIYNCLNSLVNQIEKPDEIIVVDNHCQDNTVNIAKNFPVKIIEEKKQGMIYARNYGFNHVQYQLIARIDADTQVPVDWIKKIKIKFSSNRIDGLTGPVNFYDWFLGSTFFSKMYGRVMKLFLKGKNILCGPNMVITKKIWSQVAHQVCLDDKLIHEDIDLAIHIHKAGGNINWDDDLTVLTSARRIKKNPLSFLIEYPLRSIRTIMIHH